MTILMSLDPMALFRSMPGAFAQGLVWGLMALGVYITYRLLDFADLTVDGSLATGGAVAVMLIRSGMHPWAASYFCIFSRYGSRFYHRNSAYCTWNSRNPCKYPDTDFTLFHQLKYYGKFESGCQC